MHTQASQFKASLVASLRAIHKHQHLCMGNPPVFWYDAASILQEGWMSGLSRTPGKRV